MAYKWISFKEVLDIFLEQCTHLGNLLTYLAILVFVWFFSEKLFIALLLSLIIIMGLAIGIKIVYKTNRPVKMKKNSLISSIDASSFPSVHSMRIVSLAFWISLYVNTLAMTIYMIVIALIVCASRIYLQKHYIWDIIGGVILSSVVVVLLMRGLGW